MTLNELFAKVYNKSSERIDTETALLNEEKILRREYDYYMLNLSTIASKLIEQAGRWCEHYASDFIITWDTVRNIINAHVSSTEKLEAEYVAFGFRRSGVDSNSFIASRLHDDVYSGLKEYTHIFVVEIKDALYDDFKTIHVSLANVDDTIYSVMRDNLNEYYNTNN